MYKFGDKLQNGATVVLFKDNPTSVVLAYWGNSDMNPGTHPWVTWRVDGRGDTYFGHYFADLAEAAMDFEQRVKG